MTRLFETTVARNPIASIPSTSDHKEIGMESVAEIENNPYLHFAFLDAMLHSRYYMLDIYERPFL